MGGGDNSKIIAEKYTKELRKFPQNDPADQYVVSHSSCVSLFSTPELLQLRHTVPTEHIALSKRVDNTSEDGELKVTLGTKSE